MDQSPWRFNKTPSTCQEILRNFWNLQYHDRIHKIPQLFHILNQVNLFYALPFYVFKTYSNIIPSTSRSSKWSFSFSFLPQNSARISCLPHICETCSACFSLISLYFSCMETTSINFCRYSVSFHVQFLYTETLRKPTKLDISCMSSMWGARTIWTETKPQYRRCLMMVYRI